VILRSLHESLRYSATTLWKRLHLTVKPQLYVRVARSRRQSSKDVCHAGQRRDCEDHPKAPRKNVLGLCRSRTAFRGKFSGHCAVRIMGGSVGIIRKEVIPTDENDPHWGGMPDWCDVRSGKARRDTEHATGRC
jgi:hypothetical protein